MGKGSPFSFDQKNFGWDWGDILSKNGLFWEDVGTYTKKLVYESPVSHTEAVLSGTFFSRGDLS